MTHMEEEATMMMQNLIPVLIFKYGDDVKTYFFPEAMESAKDDYWDEKLKRVMCNTEKNMADSEEPDAIGGGRWALWGGSGEHEEEVG